MQTRPRFVVWLDRIMRIVQVDFSTAQKFAFFAAVYIVYVASMVTTAGFLGVSANYFVFIPMFAAAGLFGFCGGLIFGALALPSNYVIYTLLGLSEAAPESLVIAWVSGIVTGGVLGYFGDFYRRLQAAVDLNQDLLRELHHRVKNNLGIIIGLTEHQILDCPEPIAIRALTRVKRRVFAIAAVHDRLYFSTDDTDVRYARDASEYVADLVEHLRTSVTSDRLIIDFCVEAEQLDLGTDDLVNIGLVINEFVMNSCEHAFSGVTAPTITVRLARIGGVRELRLSDNGVGLPDGFSIDTLRSLGFALMRSLAEKSGARFDLRSPGEHGVGLDVVLRWPS